MKMIETCVQHQKEEITLPAPETRSEFYNAGPFIPEEPTGNGQPGVECDTENVYGLLPPGEEAPRTAYGYDYGDWA